MAYDDPAQTDRARERNSARFASQTLLDRMNWAFAAEAERLGIPFEDARLLMMNGVRL